MRLTINCPKCRAEQPDLRVRSQVVACWRCGTRCHLRVERLRDELQTTVTPYEGSRRVKP